ncbi:hypothetical protein LPJ61_001020 [Coemansia biformis]|uniref:MAGE domain-containing protein n=1 Tax=Coemansia biformis TaxID=1286918 RepID=A0A9W7YH90_9FUNG|nr:hypothetical protein LPJ61_001020 [Coemansia biformis]
MDAEQDLERAATDMVRYALACHAAGKHIKREDVRGPVMAGLNARSFKSVLDKASGLLEESFGLRIVALPTHERRIADAEPNGTQQSKPINRWVLQSALPDAARERLEPVQSESEAATLGFAATVLSLVLVNNMSIANDQLVLFVRKLGPPDCVLPPSELRDGVAGAYATDAQLESAAQAAIGYLVKRGYLDKMSAHGARQGISDTQASQVPDAGESDASVEYTWGPQAKVKFEPLDMVRFIAAMAGQECTPDFVKTVARACGRSIAGAEAA